MEDHWFAVFEEPWLYLHRSWSGVAVYRVRFEFANDRWIIVESLINRDPQQQWRSVPDSDSEVTVLGIRLDAWAGRIADAKAAQAALFERRKVALKRRKRGANDGS
ncbi:MAG: hypothetical protein IT428_10760 [Planctomycetaceae bacterium]|nr:hypothetical protein [Planctomycetaceae bacterium]